MTESTGNEEIAKDARQHNDSGSDLDSQQRLSYQLEAYGSVPPHDSKLLKILPDGFPLFEPTTLRDEEEKCAKKDEQSVSVQAKSTSIYEDVICFRPISWTG